jgi:hypothetical protein
MVTTINIGAGDYTGGIQKRTIGKLNVGVYCDCGEFIAFAVTEPRVMDQVAISCDGPIEFTCPFCKQIQKRVVTQFENVLLTEGNKRKSTLA